MFKWLRGTHAIPAFKGKNSRSHQRRPLRELKARAFRLSLRERQFSEVECFVQFAGFPRSGHSIIGSILDAHVHCIASHELDAMGLVAADFRLREIAALIRENSRLFTDHHRFWNGFCYEVDGGMHGKATRMRVIGDKKGDWATRRCIEQPALLERVRRKAGKRSVKWILVVRNPFDNVATLSLRKNRKYDQLRIQSAGARTSDPGLPEQESNGTKAAVRADMVDDYARLCEGVAMMKSRESPRNWLEIRHEDFIARPGETIRSILAFLELEETNDFCERSARIVADNPHRSRFDVKWSPVLESRVSDLIQTHDFLSDYRFEN
ncbi:MAG: hypothetical protein ACNS61_16040 [Candidatus Wenzhouxiangella sp. M2_3B_020]